MATVERIVAVQVLVEQAHAERITSPQRESGDREQPAEADRVGKQDSRREPEAERDDESPAARERQQSGERMQRDVPADAARIGEHGEEWDDRSDSGHGREGGDDREQLKCD